MGQMMLEETQGYESTLRELILGEEALQWPQLMQVQMAQWTICMPAQTRHMAQSTIDPITTQRVLELAWRDHIGRQGCPIDDWWCPLARAYGGMRQTAAALQVVHKTDRQRLYSELLMAFKRAWQSLCFDQVHPSVLPSFSPVVKPPPPSQGPFGCQLSLNGLYMDNVGG